MVILIFVFTTSDLISATGLKQVSCISSRTTDG